MYESPGSKIINSQSRIYSDLDYENMIYNILAQLYFEVTLHFFSTINKRQRYIHDYSRQYLRAMQ